MREPLCLDVEVRPVPGTNLAVSAAGEVFGPKGRRKVQPGTNGYLATTVRLPGHVLPQRVYLHIAVLTAWRGPAPAGMEGRHADGDKANNRLSNLSWLPTR